MNPALRLMAVAAADAGGFDPLTAIPWEHAYWAEGPEFLALGLSDGASVATWPDEIGTANMTATAGNEGIYVASSLIGSKPAVRPDSGSALRGTFTSIPQPWSTVAVMRRTNTGSEYSQDGGTYETALIYNTGSFFAGAQLAGGTTGTHLWVCYGNGASSVIHQDGTDKATGNAGASAINGFSVFAGAAGTGNRVSDTNHGCFYGVYAGDVRAHGEYANFKQWVEDTYGITIA